jgi:hypothetical protein
MINFLKLAKEQEKEEWRLGRIMTLEECDRSRRAWLKRQGFKVREVKAVTVAHRKQRKGRE